VRDIVSPALDALGGGGVQHLDQRHQRQRRRHHPEKDDRDQTVPDGGGYRHGGQPKQDRFPPTGLDATACGAVFPMPVLHHSLTVVLEQNSLIRDSARRGGPTGGRAAGLKVANPASTIRMLLPFSLLLLAGVAAAEPPPPVLTLAQAVERALAYQ